MLYHHVYHFLVGTKSFGDYHKAAAALVLGNMGYGVQIAF